MTIAERVSKFIADNRPDAFCDDCIAEKLGLSRRQEAQPVTAALATTSDFRRESDQCALCGKQKLVIRRT